MCVNSIGVACADVERLCIIDVAETLKPEFSPQGGLLQTREAQRVTSHYE